jgi:hypothetical protein
MWADRRRLRNVVLARSSQTGLINVAKWRAALEAAHLRTKVTPMRARFAEIRGRNAVSADAATNLATAPQP